MVLEGSPARDAPHPKKESYSGQECPTVRKSQAAVLFCRCQSPFPLVTSKQFFQGKFIRSFLCRLPANLKWIHTLRVLQLNLSLETATMSQHCRLASPLEEVTPVYLNMKSYNAELFGIGQGPCKINQCLLDLPRPSVYDLDEGYCIDTMPCRMPGPNLRPLVVRESLKLNKYSCKHDFLVLEVARAAHASVVALQPRCGWMTAKNQSSLAVRQ